MTRYTKGPTGTGSLGWFMAVAITSVGILTACGGKKQETAPIQTDVVERRDIIITTEGTGTVEPVDTVAVKSQASGLIMKMPIEVGASVKPGDLIAQIDTRNLQNDFTRIAAAAQAAESTVVVSNSALRRAEELHKQGVITAVELDAAKVNNATSRSSLIAAQTNLRVAQQNLEFATVRSEVSGTVISKSASVGTVAASALSNVGGGSTLVTIADLSRVRMRVLVNETDIAQVRVGQSASVSIDAMPNRTFNGIVEKVEPKAVIQQSVTMFPVLVSLENADQSLLPGMNGEVTMVIQERRDALSVPIDALRSRAELTAVASGLGINEDSLQAMMQSVTQAPGQAAGAGNTPGRESAAAGSGKGAGDSGVAGVSGVSGVSGGARRPGASGRNFDSSAANRAGGAGGAASGAGAQGGRRRGGRMGQGGAGASAQGGNAGGQFGGAAPGGANGASGAQGRGAGASGRRAQMLFAFVKEGDRYIPKRVRVGVTNFDYAEVLDGLREGEQVALLSVAVAQGERNASSARVRSMTGGGLPGAPAAGGGGRRAR